MLFDTHAHYDSGAFNQDRLEVLDPPAGETEVGDEGYMEFHVDAAALRQTVIDLFYEPRQAS